jgi:hypothetical protein
MSASLLSFISPVPSHRTGCRLRRVRALDGTGPPRHTVRLTTRRTVGALTPLSLVHRALALLSISPMLWRNGAVECPFFPFYFPHPCPCNRVRRCLPRTSTPPFDRLQAPERRCHHRDWTKPPPPSPSLVKTVVWLPFLAFFLGASISPPSADDVGIAAHRQRALESHHRRNAVAKAPHH